MKRNHIIALIIIAVCVGGIVSTVSDSSTYETFATAASLEGRQFHIVGEYVEEMETYYDAQQDANYFSFHLRDREGEVKKVVFLGTKPQDFERAEQIVLTGKMAGEEFLASQILMKCPSKYVEDEIQLIEAKASS